MHSLLCAIFCIFSGPVLYIYAVHCDEADASAIYRNTPSSLYDIIVKLVRGVLFPAIEIVTSSQLSELLWVLSLSSVVCVIVA